MSEILWCADNGDGTYRNPVLYCDYVFGKKTSEI